MVKRQTVWLSTMMVLSLMLIGYYTMNNESTTTSASTDGNSVTASISPVTSANQTTTASSGGKADTSKTSGNPSGSDWYVSTQTQQDQQMAQQIETDQAVLSNNNASSEQLTKAQQDLSALTAEQGQLTTAKEMVLGHGYTNCVILPNKDSSQFIVYVKTAKLSNTQAVEIMNIVSTQLNISPTNVVVKAQA